MRKWICFYFEVELQGAFTFITSIRRRRQRGLSFSLQKIKYMAVQSHLRRVLRPNCPKRHTNVSFGIILVPCIFLLIY